MEACPQMLTYLYVRCALGQDIRSYSAKFSAFKWLHHKFKRVGGNSCTSMYTKISGLAL